LVKAMASRDKLIAYQAQAALASFMSKIVAEVINNAATLSNLFTTLEYNADDNPSLPLDLYYDISDDDYVKIWSQSSPGGLPSNHVMPIQSELKMATYPLNTAVDFERKYAVNSRLDVVGKTFTRIAQEFLIK